MVKYDLNYFGFFNKISRAGCKMAFLSWSFIYGLLTGSSVYAILSWIHDKSRNKNKILDSDDCFLFEPKMDTMDCMKEEVNPCKMLTCSACNSKKFLALIKSAEITLDVCVYLITSKELSKVIVTLFKKGVHVRIILDRQMSSEAQNSKMFVLIKEHIPIKVINTGEMMHNKFVIIDQKKLITGSFNWTNQGLMYNYENAILTHNEEIIKKYKTYFESMWLTPEN